MQNKGLASLTGVTLHMVLTGASSGASGGASARARDAATASDSSGAGAAASGAKPAALEVIFLGRESTSRQDTGMASQATNLAADVAQLLQGTRFPWLVRFGLHYASAASVPLSDQRMVAAAFRAAAAAPWALLVGTSLERWCRWPEHLPLIVALGVAMGIPVLFTRFQGDGQPAFLVREGRGFTVQLRCARPQTTWRRTSPARSSCWTSSTPTALRLRTAPSPKSP